MAGFDVAVWLGAEPAMGSRVAALPDKVRSTLAKAFAEDVVSWCVGWCDAGCSWAMPASRSVTNKPHC